MKTLKYIVAASMALYVSSSLFGADSEPVFKNVEDVAQYLSTQKENQFLSINAIKNNATFLQEFVNKSKEQLTYENDTRTLSTYMGRINYIETTMKKIDNPLYQRTNVLKNFNKCVYMLLPAYTRNTTTTTKKPPTPTTIIKKSIFARYPTITAVASAGLATVTGAGLAAIALKTIKFIKQIP